MVTSDDSAPISVATIIMSRRIQYSECVYKLIYRCIYIKPKLITLLTLLQLLASVLNGHRKLAD